MWAGGRWVHWVGWRLTGPRDAQRPTGELHQYLPLQKRALCSPEVLIDDWSTIDGRAAKDIARLPRCRQCFADGMTHESGAKEPINA